MELYLLKSAAILAIFFAFYKLIFEQTSIHNFKRFYLLGSLLASFIIPLITFITYVETAPFVASINGNLTAVPISETVEIFNFWPFILWIIYGLGVLFFSVKFLGNLFNLIQKIRKNPKYKNRGFIKILLCETIIPHTFLNYIFLTKSQFENGEIPREVMLHEETHAIEKHSLDILLIEILQIVFWFNPIFYFFKKSIKLNHEFLADRAVLNAGVETTKYQNILLTFSTFSKTPSLANSLNYSSIKKRFTVMKTHTSKRAIWVRTLLILPLFSFLVYSFSSQEIALKTSGTSEVIKEKATKEEIKVYNKLAKKYNAVAIEKRIIPLNDLKQLETIYRKMTDDQLDKAEPFPECLPKKAPKAPKAPDVSKVPSVPNGDLYMAPEAPPAPNANPVEYIKELAKRGALFYIGPHKYSSDEALELLQKNPNTRIDVSKYPIVSLDGC